MVVEWISLCWLLSFMTYGNFLSRCQNLLNLWIKTIVNYESTIAEVQWNNKMIQISISYRCTLVSISLSSFYLKILGALVFYFSTISDEKLQTPWQKFWPFLIVVSLFSQRSQLFHLALLRLYSGLNFHVIVFPFTDAWFFVDVLLKFWLFFSRLVLVYGTFFLYSFHRCGDQTNL